MKLDDRSRQAAMAASGALLALGTSLGGAAHAQEEEQITFFIWAGSNQGVVPMKVIEAYREAHPNVTIDVLESNNTITYPKMVAARRTTPDDPLVHCGFFNVDSMNKGDVDDMWESIDPKLVPNMEHVLEDYIRSEARGVGYQMSGIGILYNAEKVEQPPTSWSVLWEEDNDNEVVFFDYDTRMLAIAARLNGGDEHDIDPGFEIWSENADNIRALVDSNDGVKNLLVSGDALYSPWFSSLATVWIEEGAPLGFAAPEEGMIAFPIYLTISQGVTEAERRICSDLINELLSPENAGEYGRLTFAIPVVTNAVLSEEQQANPLLNLDQAESAILLDYAHIAEMSAEWRERWDREVKLEMR